MTARRPALLALLALIALNTHAEDGRKGILVDLNGEASQSAANDSGQATAFAEAEAASPAEAARKVNTAMSQALALCKQTPQVQCRSSHTWTSPVYGKNGRSIDAWRMRSEIAVESRDLPAFAELLSKLQANLGIGQVNLHPAAETRQQAEDRATVTAIDAFRAKAKLVASRLGHDYRIVQMQIGSNRGPVFPVRPMALRADAAAMPIEAGESQVTVTVSGQIEVQP